MFNPYVSGLGERRATRSGHGQPDRSLSWQWPEDRSREGLADQPGSGDALPVSLLFLLVFTFNL